ncbi:MAG: hypothetical protein QW273_03450 [Candidatus Pacearchaeota archaeon]
MKKYISKSYIQSIFNRKIIKEENFKIWSEKNFLEKYSKDHGLNPKEINTKILIYEDRVKGWFLDIATELKSLRDSGFVILQIVLSYVEGIQQYINGKISKGKSKEFFKEGLIRIYPELEKKEKIDEILNNFYKEVRCGLFHTGMVGKSVKISGDYLRALNINERLIEINPHLFLEDIKKDFENYIKKLKDESNEEDRKKFEKIFDELNITNEENDNTKN